MDKCTDPNLPRMPDEQVTGLAEAVAGALRAASFGPFRFVRAKERYNHTQIRQLHAYALEGRVDLRPRDLYSIEVHADAATLADLVNALEAPLSPYIDAGSGKLGFHQTELTLDDLAKAAIRAAAIASPEEAVAALRLWAGGAPWVHTRTFTVTGITLESPLHIGTGVSLRRLPEQPHEMHQFVPGLLVDELQRPGFLLWGVDVLGATVLCTEEYHRPVFWPGNERPARVEELAFPGGWDGFVFAAARAVCRLQHLRRVAVSVEPHCAPATRFRRRRQRRLGWLRQTGRSEGGPGGPAHGTALEAGSLRFEQFSNCTKTGSGTGRPSVRTVGELSARGSSTGSVDRDAYCP